MSCGCGCGAPARPNGSYASDACRARAWKARRNYGPQEPLEARSNGNVRRSKPSGVQASYFKAVDKVSAGVIAEFDVDAVFARWLAGRWLREALPEKQRARMHAINE